MRSREKILIVDDEEIIRSLLNDILEEMGHDCGTAKDGAECLEKISSDAEITIVLLDIHMPNLNGLQTLIRLKSHSGVSPIMVSASRDTEDLRLALREGAYDYIFKPFDVDEVKAVIGRAAERSRLIRENRDYQENLEKKVIQQTKKLVGIYSDTLEALVLTLDLREHGTSHHSYRVTEYAINLAKQMSLSSADLSVIAMGALLHDIGKIGIPDSILLKPGELTKDEWQVMRTHPVSGYNILKQIEFLEPSAKIVLTHHERFDGRGYNGGLAGEQIPIGARIFSVIDALDAMTSDRPYRKAMPFGKAIEEIAKSSGTQFDPEIVNVFLRSSLGNWIEIKSRIEISGSKHLKNLLYQLSRA
ncbi:MAG: HD domain-containing phosphohydrolase [Deltaproteobacteria bacterium]